MIKVSDYIVNRLLEAGTKVFFGYQGGNISHLIDSIGNHVEAEFVETCHEQAAAFAANAYGRLNDCIGVAVASSGPGAINIINGIANSFCDSIPCIFFTGDVNTTAKKAHGSTRQNAFQEIDIISMVKPITKYATTIFKPEDIVDELENALNIAQTGRPGPVLINLPHDVQRAYIDEQVQPSKVQSSHLDYLDLLVKDVVDVIYQSARPVFLIGGGLSTSKIRVLFNHILSLIEIPVVCSLMGLDIVKHNHPCYRGVVGDYGNVRANKVLKNSDCIIVLGNRLDDRQISYTLAEDFKKADKTIIHVDIDSNELGNKLKENFSIESDAYEFLSALEKSLPITKKFDFWLNESWYQMTDTELPLSFHPNSFIKRLSESCEATYTFDVGNNQMHCMHSVHVDGNTRILSSGGLGSMGFSLPAAVGASFSNYNEKVIAICGDGGIQMNIQELQTISFYNLPVNILLLNNSGLGMIYNLQDKLFQGRHYGSTENYGTPCFKDIAVAYGFKYMRVDCTSDYASAIDLLKNDVRVFVEFVFDIRTSVNDEEKN